MCTALYMMVLYDRARVGPTTNTSDEISIICFFRLIMQAKSFVLFYLWYSSCFEVKCWFHTFSKWCSHIPMWILILLDHRVCLVNPFFNRCVSPQVDPFTSTFARSFITSSQWCCFIRLQVAFVFPTLPPFYFSSRTKISSSSIHFIDGKFLHSFPSMFLSGDSHEDSNGASSLSFLVLFFSGGFNSSFGIKHTPFLFFPMLFLCWCTS